MTGNKNTGTDINILQSPSKILTLPNMGLGHILQVKFKVMWLVVNLICLLLIYLVSNGQNYRKL